MNNTGRYTPYKLENSIIMTFGECCEFGTLSEKEMLVHSYILLINIQHFNFNGNTGLAAVFPECTTHTQSYSIILYSASCSATSAAINPKKNHNKLPLISPENSLGSVKNNSLAIDPLCQLCRTDQSVPIQPRK